MENVTAADALLRVSFYKFQQSFLFLIHNEKQQFSR